MRQNETLENTYLIKAKAATDLQKEVIKEFVRELFLCDGDWYYIDIKEIQNYPHTILSGNFFQRKEVTLSDLCKLKEKLRLDICGYLHMELSIRDNTISACIIQNDSKKDSDIIAMNVIL